MQMNQRYFSKTTGLVLFLLLISGMALFAGGAGEEYATFKGKHKDT